MTILIWDETLPARDHATSPAASLEIDASRATLRDLLRQRVRQEVERYNSALPETFQGLVQPEESERVLNGYRPKVRRPLDWEAQFRQACLSFDKNGFLVLVDEQQVMELDEPLTLLPETRVQFVKLVPLVGG
jgi:hypothetical protein